MSLLHAQGIEKRFGALVAVNDFRLTVEPGEVVGLVGPNGAGKTTTFNILSGLLPASRGSVSFNGHRVEGWSAHRRANAGMARTFQTPQLFTELSVRDNVLSATLAEQLGPLNGSRRSARAKPHARPIAERLDEALALTGLSHLAEETAGDLSYGMQRRLEIARALMTEPELLLLDEPAAGMQPHEALHIGDLIGDVRAKGISVVVIDHNMRLIMSVSDRVVVMNFGAVIAEGTPDAVRAHPEVIRAYLGGN